MIERGVTSSSTTEQSKGYHAVCIGDVYSEEKRKIGPSCSAFETGIEKSFLIFFY